MVMENTAKYSCAVWR